MTPLHRNQISPSGAGRRTERNMRRVLLAAVGFAAILASPAVSHAQTLPQNELLKISATDSVWFKAHTNVSFSGPYVKSGTLLYTTPLNNDYAPNQISFAAGTVINFTGYILNNINVVSSGTLASTTALHDNYTSQTINFAGGTWVLFSDYIENNVNLVKTGTLASATNLYINYTKTKLFPAGTTVTFSEDIINNINPVID